MSSRYVVGVDLGTTNTVIAFLDTARADAAAEVLAVDQLVAPGEVARLPLLPSALYLPGEHDLPPGATRLPWGEPGYAVGQLARTQGARVPGRLVTSAKSWLCHASVDRTAPVLPWGAPAEVAQVSPVEASARTLSHLREAWNHRFPDGPLEAQEIVLTVPASFDEVARELTVRAARQAGLERFVLLEEPQAAFYDWLSRHPRDLASALGDRRLILVVDVGGGTTDLTLIHARVEGGEARLTRLAVGDHLLLGGDNMDMALARLAEERLAGGGRLDAVQWSLLVQAARTAKEALLVGGAPERAKVSIVGRGARLVGGTLATELRRSEVLEKVVEGFFPHVPADAAPMRGKRGAIQELGLPFEADPAVSRHIASFLRRHAATSAEAVGPTAWPLPRPDAVLLNGGVFNARQLRARLVEVMSRWYPGAPPIELLDMPDASALDLAVARGAAWFGQVRRGEGVRIGGGSARAYYVAVASPAGEHAALCVIPRRQEEGVDVELKERSFALTLGRPVRFALFSSTGGAAHRPGELVRLGDEAEALPPIETVLTAPQGLSGEIPVRLWARLTELGTLELWCAADDPKRPNELRWKLELSLRGGDASGAGPIEPLPKRFEEARERVERVYGKKPLPVTPRDVKDLFRDLEKVLGPREGWSSAICRELWAALHLGMARRRRSADHERLWCQLTGYALRPGFGHPLDAWRVRETWTTFAQGLQFHLEKPNWSEWWILWRRVAGGLDAEAQRALWSAILPHLLPSGDTKRLKGVRPEGQGEMLRLAASLERVEAADKQALGDALVAQLTAPDAGGQLAWAVGRLGARQPFYGSAHAVVAPAVAERWLEALLALDWARVEGAAFAAMLLARMTGDRARDVTPDLRERVGARLAQACAPDAWIIAVREGAALERAEQVRAFGESLPAGLRILG